MVNYVTERKKKRGDGTMGFLDTEKAYDRVNREMLGSLRKVGKVQK